MILKDLEICEVASESQASTGLNICNDTQRKTDSDLTHSSIEFLRIIIRYVKIVPYNIICNKNDIYTKH